MRLALFKLIEVIEEENAILQQHNVVSHAGFTERKNHLLRDLMMIQRAGGDRETDEQVRNLLVRLSAALKVNASLLRLHISAMGEISDVIVSGLRAADSDGTYTRKADMSRT